MPVIFPCLDHIFELRGEAGGIGNVHVYSQTKATSIRWLAGVPLPAKEGWYFHVNIPTYTAGDTLNSHVLVEEEDAY